MLALLVHLALALTAPVSAELQPAPAPSPAPLCWQGEHHRFPQILNTWRKVIAWEKEDASAEGLPSLFLEACREGNLPLAAAAHVRLSRHDLESLLPEEFSEEDLEEFHRHRESIRSEALAYMQNPTERWGSEILLERVFNRGGIHPSLPEALLLHFRDDDIPFNANHAAEFYISGLRQDRSSFLPPLLDRLDEVTRKGEDEQEELFLLSLALGVVLRDEEGYAAHNWLWAATSPPEYPSREPLAGLTPRQISGLVTASVKLQGNGEWQGREQVPRPPLHDMARLFLELTFPEGRDLLSARVLDGSLQNLDAAWVLGLHLAHDPEGLLADHGGVLVEVVRGSSYLCPTNRLCARNLGELFTPHASLETHKRRPYRGRKLFQSESMREWDEYNWPSFADWHGEATALLREALRVENDPRKQLALSHALQAAGDESSRELRALMAVTHLVDDDLLLNAHRSQMLLEEMGEEATLYVVAGLRAGMEENEWQLVVMADSVLHQIDPNYDPAQWPDVHEYLWDQMKDDEIFGNERGAMHYFMRWGPESLRFLERQENNDPQRHRLIARIANGLAEQAE